MNITGIVYKSTGSWYDVHTAEGVIPSRIIGKYRLQGLKLTNPVAVGDQVHVVKNEDGSGNIVEILPRTNYVVRQSPRKKHSLHLIASNIDQAMLVTTIRQPNLKPGFIDRFLLMTEPYNIPTIIVFNKCDLYSEEDLELYAVLKAIYEDIGYGVFLTSAEAGLGLEEVSEMLKDKVTLISGQSGVGKSTLINALHPGFGLKTHDLSDASGKGQHTTTFAEMFDLPTGGKLIDTPGIKTLSFTNFTPQDVAHNFREIFEQGRDCKFSDCTHRNEPKCAVKEAVEQGEISFVRYENYLHLLEEIESQNYWERHDM